MQTENPDSKVIRPQPGKCLHNTWEPNLKTVPPLFLDMIYYCVFKFCVLSLLVPPRHVCEDSVRARQAEGLCQHLSVSLSPASSRTLQRGACGPAPIRRSQWLQSSHEPWRAARRSRQQYVCKIWCCVFIVRHVHYLTSFCGDFIHSLTVCSIYNLQLLIT